jgi:DNA-binding winged helix-turn-helix (wHTH) protein
MAAGLYIDRKEILHGSIDQMTSKDVEEKLNELRKKLQENGDNAKVIESDPSQGEPVGSDSSDVVSEEGQLSIQDHS